jgi:hypothetical protein
MKIFRQSHEKMIFEEIRDYRPDNLENLCFLVFERTIFNTK